MTAFGISEKAYGVIIQLFDKYPQINKVVIYGSRCKGNFSDRSDVDLVVCESVIDRYALGHLISDINDSDFPYTVDIQIFESIRNQQLIDHISRVGKIFYTKK